MVSQKVTVNPNPNLFWIKTVFAQEIPFHSNWNYTHLLYTRCNRPRTNIYRVVSRCVRWVYKYFQLRSIKKPQLVKTANWLFIWWCWSILSWVEFRHNGFAFALDGPNVCRGKTNRRLLWCGIWMTWNG